MYLCINLVCTLSGDAANELHYVWLIAVTKNFSQLDLSQQTFSSFLPCGGYNKKDILYSRGKSLLTNFLVLEKQKLWVRI